MILMTNLFRKQTRSIYVLKSFAQDIFLTVNSLDAQKNFKIVSQSLCFFEKKSILKVGLHALSHLDTQKAIWAFIK